MEYNKKVNKVNEILAEWNPIGVPPKISKDEYSSYVLSLFNYETNYLGLVERLESILTDDIELEYDSENIDDKKELLFFAHKIFEILND